MITGLLSRTVYVAERPALELLGPGDVLRPWVGLGYGEATGVEVRWEVHDAALLALLNREFVERTSQWPQVTAALMDRLLLRARRLALQLAATAQPSTEQRLLLLLWQLADRWGQREAEGTWVPLRLTHELLAAAIGVTRPTVSAAAAYLRRVGVASRRPGGTWLLHGEPPGAHRRPEADNSRLG